MMDPRAITIEKNQNHLKSCEEFYKKYYHKKYTNEKESTKSKEEEGAKALFYEKFRKINVSQNQEIDEFLDAFLFESTP